MILQSGERPWPQWRAPCLGALPCDGFGWCGGSGWGVRGWLGVVTAVMFIGETDI
jgi:hypothetical protein